MGAREVLRSCAGWLMVSASRTTSWRDLASSKILSISLWTSAENDWGKEKLYEASFHSDQTWVKQNTPTPSRVFTFIWGNNRHNSPRLERVFDLSIMAFLFSTERFASDRSAVTRVMEILQDKHLITVTHNSSKGWDRSALSGSYKYIITVTYRPWNTNPTSCSSSDGKPSCSCRQQPDRCTHLPSNLCLRKSNKAFCIMSVT